MLISVKLLTKHVITIWTLHENSTSESKPLQSRSKGKIIGQARRKERLSRSKLKRVFLIDSDAELFLYLIRCIRFGSWIVRRLNWALVQLNPQLKDPSKLLLIYMYSCYGDFIPIEVWIPRRALKLSLMLLLRLLLQKDTLFNTQDAGNHILYSGTYIVPISAK